MLGENQARSLADAVLKRCGVDAGEVSISAEDSALTRFANNVIHQNVAESNVSITVRIIQGKRSGTATTNRLDERALDEAVARARANAQASPEDPDDPGLPGPAAYRKAAVFDPRTAEMAAQERAEQVGIVCRLAAEKDLNASGAFSTGSSEMIVANTAGVFAYHPATRADFQTVMMSADSSGRAQQSSWCAADLPAEVLGKEAVRKAEMGRNPRKIEPETFPVVLEPYAVLDLLQMLNFSGIGAQSVLDGRSWMNDRIGVKAVSEMVHLWDDGLDPLGIPLPFDYEGVPKQRVDIIKEGVVQGPVYDRRTALRSGKQSTGHAMPPSFRDAGPMAINLFLGSGDSSLDAMIASIDRGVYINRFWYTRLVHPKDCVITGMTRDGVYMIENGEVAYPIKNLRFTQSYVDALNRVEAVGADTKLLVNDYGHFASRVPALKIGAFHFTGTTV